MREREWGSRGVFVRDNMARILVLIAGIKRGATSPARRDSGARKRKVTSGTHHLSVLTGCPHLSVGGARNGSLTSGSGV